MVGTAPNDGTFRLVNFNEYYRIQSHKNDSFDDYKKTVFHEFIHFCHHEVGKTGLNFFNEGLAHYLAGQRAGKIDLTNYSADDLFNNSNFSKLKNKYPVAHKCVEKLIHVLPHEEILEYVKNPKKLRNDKEKIMKILHDKSLDVK